MKTLLFISTLIILTSTYSFADTIFHDLNVQIKPHQHSIHVTDQISLNKKLCKKRIIQFQLHKGLNPQSVTKNVQIKKVGHRSDSINIEIFEIKKRTGQCSVILTYNGEIHHTPVANESPGTIETDGVFLGSSSKWYPYIQNTLVGFQLSVTIPKPWRVVSQGQLISSKSKSAQNTFTWLESHPQDDIYIVAAKFSYYESEGVITKIEAYLRTPDAQLAQKYISATKDYLQLYSQMIGPYPYSKFALVENFWDTGFGMPSFTLLGSNVIRLPFILYTSYPHEILHNWWGNGVYVDYQSGNWAEGLTSYMADHYFKDQRNKGFEYRRTALNNFASYVDQTNDFPLNKFTHRYDQVSSAIGYSKSLMFFHMLKVQLGDALFSKGLQHFYKNNLFKISGYEDMRKSFESVSKVDLDSIFNQWVNHTGAPKLQIDETRLIPSKSSWQMRLTLSQQQSFNVYKLYIPIKIELNNGQVINEKIFMDQKVQTVFFNVNEKPKSIVIDPQFDIFRHLYSEEVPPALSEIFGEKSKLNIVLPSNSPYIKKYMLFAEKMKTKYPFNVNIIEDKNIALLPSRGSLWILGWSSKFKTQLQCLFNKAGANFSPSKVTYNGTDFKSNESTLITTLNDRLDTATNCLENNSKQKTAWIGLHQTTDVQTIINKIFHYGSYSFIGFNSNSKNIIKAQWETKNSPLKVHF